MESRVKISFFFPQLQFYLSALLVFVVVFFLGKAAFIIPAVSQRRHFRLLSLRLWPVCHGMPFDKALLIMFTTKRIFLECWICERWCTKGWSGGKNVESLKTERNFDLWHENLRIISYWNDGFIPQQKKIPILNIVSFVYDSLWLNVKLIISNTVCQHCIAPHPRGGPWHLGGPGSYCRRRWNVFDD